MSNPLSAPVSVPEEPNVETVGEFLAGVLCDVLDDASAGGLLTATDVDALEAAVGTDWSPLKDAVESALTNRILVDVNSIVASFGTAPTPAKPLPLPRGVVRVTIEVDEETFVAEYSAREKLAGGFTIGRGFAEHIGHTVGNQLTAYWGPFGAGAVTPPTDPALASVLRGIHQASVRPAADEAAAA